MQSSNPNLILNSFKIISELFNISTLSSFINRLCKEEKADICNAVSTTFSLYYLCDCSIIIEEKCPIVPKKKPLLKSLWKQRKEGMSFSLTLLSNSSLTIKISQLDLSWGHEALSSRFVTQERIPLKLQYR